MTRVSEAVGRAVLLAALVVGRSALGADPEVSVDAEGAVVGTVLIPAPEDAVRAWVDDPVAVGSLSSQVVSVETRRDGACQAVTTHTRGLFRPLLFKSRRCPTTDGWVEQMTESEDFDAYETRWNLQPVDGGTKVTVRVKTEVTGAPEAIVRSSTRRSVVDLLEALVSNVVRRSPR